MHKKVICKYVPVMLMGFFVLTFSLPCVAMQLHLSFAQILQQADLIFVGRVLDKPCRYSHNQKMIFTDVRFELVNLVHKSKSCQAIGEKEIILTFAGGQIGEEIIRVSDVPSLELGATYLIFTRMDGSTYASPIIGSFQGLFEIIRDEDSGILYPLAYGRKAIVGIRRDRLVTGPPVAGIRKGVIDQPTRSIPDRFHDVAPKPTQEFVETGAEASVKRPAKEIPKKIMTLDEFIQEIDKRIE